MAGSKAMQYKTEKTPESMFPGKNRGVSNVIIGKNKVLCTVDDVIRVYSFDANN